MHPVRHIQFTNEIRFERPREEVFDKFLETDKWFQISYGQERLQSVVNERRVIVEPQTHRVIQVLE